MALVKHYKELRDYKQAFAATSRIYTLSKHWPKEERYSLTDQIRRSSRSICANIAEAWRKRRYPAHFISKLSDSDSEAAETEVWLDFALYNSHIHTLPHSDSPTPPHSDPRTPPHSTDEETQCAS